MHRPFTLGTVIIVVAVAQCRADVVPIEAYQAVKAKVFAVSGGMMSAAQSFDLSAPDPLASWSPPTQDIAATLGGAGAHLVSTYSSSIGPHAVTFEASIRLDGTGAPTGEGCYFDWSREFFLRFAVTTPGAYAFSGEVRRVREGWVTPIYPAGLSLSGYPTPVIVSLQIGSPPMGGPPFVASYGPTILLLTPGEYVLHASDHSTQVGSFDSPNDFESTAVLSFTEVCYADCNLSGTLTVADFTCFQTKFVAGDPYADCNQSGTLSVADFTCFQSMFVAGCP